MEPTTAPVESPPVPAGLWKSWRIYLVRWLIFAAIAGLFQPVLEHTDQFWEQKLYQVFNALPFGVACAVAFTLAQNTLNVQRVRWKSWVNIFVVWMGMKFVFVGVVLVLGGTLSK